MATDHCYISLSFTDVLRCYHFQCKRHEGHPVTFVYRYQIESAIKVMYFPVVSQHLAFPLLGNNNVYYKENDLWCACVNMKLEVLSLAGLI